MVLQQNETSNKIKNILLQNNTNKSLIRFGLIGTDLTQKTKIYLIV